jgi:carboxymethylenebutenolidase
MLKHAIAAALSAFIVLYGSPSGWVRAETPGDARAQVVETPVRYLSGADTVSGVLYRPAGDSALPGVVVIHEWWGLNDWIKESAKRIAATGCVALAIDLYRGHVAGTAEEAHELMRGVPEDRAARDLKSAVQFLRSRRDVDGTRIGAVGWCMGGGYALQTALVVPDLAACVICYGRLVSEDSTIQGLHASVHGIFGADDRGIPRADVVAFQEQARRLGKNVTMEVFDGVGHAFMNPNNTAGYQEAAATRAWKSILDFLAVSLLKPPSK